MRVPLKTGWIDLETGRGVVAGDDVLLTSTERRFLALVCREAGETVDYDRLTTEVWDARPGTKDRAIESLLRRLRGKLGESAREPVHLYVEHGHGVRFVRGSGKPEGRSWAGSVRSRAAATAWLDGRLPSTVPAHRVYEWAGGTLDVLEGVAELGSGLSGDVLDQLDPLDLTLPGGTPRERLGPSAADRTPSALQVATSLVPVGTAGIDRGQLARLAGVPLIELLEAVAELAEAGWLWVERDRLGFDPLVRRWLCDRVDLDAAEEAHLRWVEAFDGATSRRYWTELALAARRAPDRIVGPLQPGSQVRTCGGTETTPVDDALIEVAAALADERPHDARALFVRIPEPATALGRFRWANFGGQVAITVGDLERGAQLARVCQQVAATLGPAVRVQAAALVDEIDHRLGRNAKALETTPFEGVPEFARDYFTALMLRRRFEHTPTEALAARHADLVRTLEGSRPHAQVVIYGMSMDAELGRPPPPADLDAALAQLVESYPPPWYLRNAAYTIALSCLPDEQAAFEAWRRAPPDPVSFLTRLDDAALQRVLFDDPGPLRDGGFGDLARVVEEAAVGRGPTLDAGPAWRLVGHLRRGR